MIPDPRLERRVVPEIALGCLSVRCDQPELRLKMAIDNRETPAHIAVIGFRDNTVPLLRQRIKPNPRLGG